MRLSKTDLIIVALFALTVVGIERSHQRDIEAPDAAALVITAAPSCQDILENRRFAMRRMMIADGSLALGNTWRNDALLGACPAN
ncbi:MAG: hypothetical protein WCE79_00035 [Xanthobacteraceae bacterium]